MALNPVFLSQPQIARQQSEHCKEVIRIAAAEAIGMLSDEIQWGHTAPAGCLHTIGEVRQRLDKMEAAARVLAGAL